MSRSAVCLHRTGLHVTLVYRREAGEWRLAHRHADPLVEGVSLDEAAALARGERAQAKAK